MLTGLIVIGRRPIFTSHHKERRATYLIRVPKVITSLPGRMFVTIEKRKKKHDLSSSGEKLEAIWKKY